MTINHGADIMRDFEVIYAEVVQAEDFFDAVSKLNKDHREILSCSEIPIEDNDVFDESD